MQPILVTGAARGLGREISLQLAAQGHDLVLHYRKSKQNALRVIEHCQKLGVQAQIIQGDFSTSELLEDFISGYLARFSNTKGLVNNVGNYVIAPIDETSKDTWTDLFQTNFFTPVFLIQALLPSIQNQRGNIVNIGVSGVKDFRPFTKATAYAASKSALWFYTLSLAKKFAPHFVNVNMVSPGYLTKTIDKENPQKLPRKRFIDPQEVARVVAFLFDQKSESITGQNIEVAGGI